jgi:GNAT superfamily N-acetyltransferase
MSGAGATLEDALALAAAAHRGQLYPGPDEEPYVLHPLRVMAAVAGAEERIVALLHDVVEDSATTLEDLRRLGYADPIVAAVDALTRRDGETYEAYVERAGADAIARSVKLADLADNLANNRRLAPTEATRDRIDRYERARARLLEVEAGRPSPVVRAARSDDAPAIAELYRRWEAEDITRGLAADPVDRLLARLGPYWFVAELAGRVVGFVGGATRESEGLAVIPAGQAYLEVEDLYVEARQRSRGLGGRLLDRALREAAARGVERALVYSSNRDWQRTVAFYRRHGFEMWFVRMVR